MKLLFLEDQISMPIMKLPVRCVLVKTNKGVLMISPIKFTSSQLQQIMEFGEVTDIISPSLIHSLFIRKATKRFPNATVWAPPGMREKFPIEKFPKMKIDKILTQDPWPYEDQIDIQLIKGAPKMTEVVFYCKQLRTILVTDLAFNLQHPHGWGARIFPRFVGTYKKFAVSRLWNLFIKDKTAFQKSIQGVLEWDFDQVVMSHGEILTSNGKAMLQKSASERGYLPRQPSATH
jgi:hypothetical protein